MKWILIVVGCLALLVALVALVGSLLPVKHVATRAARLHQPPAAIWAAITGVDAFPSWRTSVKKIERLPDHQGRPSWREVDNHGQAVPFEIEEWVPSQRFVTRIADPRLPFGGSWTYEIRTADGGSELRITENGEVYNPIFRFLSRFVFGHHATMDAYLRALGQKFGERVQLEE